MTEGPGQNSRRPFIIICDQRDEGLFFFLGGQGSKEGSNAKRGGIAGRGQKGSCEVTDKPRGPTGFAVPTRHMNRGERALQAEG